MAYHLYIIPALMEEWGVHTLTQRDVRDPDRTGLTMTILNTVHVDMKLQQKATLSQASGRSIHCTGWCA